MKTRKLGKQGLVVSEIGLGCMGMDHAYGPSADRQEMIKVCEELGIGFVAYSPLGNGFLSGKYTKDTKYGEGDFRNFMGRFKPEVIYI